MGPERHPSPDLGDVTHVFFDVGGTLLYPEPSPSDIFHRILTARGHRIDRASIVRLLRTPESIVTLIRPFQAGREAEFFRSINARVIEHLGFDSDEPMLDEIQSEFGSGIAWKLFPDVADTLESLRDAGLHIGVISNASHTLPETLRKAGLARYFDTVTYSFGVGFEKPDVRIFRRAVATANASEDRSLHVGDSFEADYVGARRAGLHAILLQREGEPPTPCPTVRTLAALRDILTTAHSPRRKPRRKS
jgi:putative hydrolase of the HAD superfamily